METHDQLFYRSTIFALLLLIIASCDSSTNPHTETGIISGDLSLMESSSHVGTTTTEYEILDLGSLGGKSAEAFGINDAGQVVGQSATEEGEQHAFLWDEKNGMTDLGTLGGTFSYARDINEAGQIVGGSMLPSGEVHAVLWKTNGEIINLGTLGGELSAALAINDAGKVVGWSENSIGRQRAFIWDEVNGMRDLGTLGGNASFSQGINNTGQVAGISKVGTEERAFIWDEENGMSNLGTLDGFESFGLGINEAGQVTGHSRIPSQKTRAFIWDETNGMRNIGTLGGNSWAYDINDNGKIVGVSSKQRQNRAFLWDEVGGIRDLGSLEDFTSYAYSINNVGQVVGYSRVTSGYRRATLWNPAQTETNAPPVAHAGLNQTLECKGMTTVVNLDGSGSSDPDGDELSYSWSFDGSEIATGINPQIELPDGTHSITLIVTDPDGMFASNDVVITIKDSTPPTIAYKVEHQTLWPPNHKMYLAVSNIIASDVCDTTPAVSVSITSSESLNGIGDGNTDQDWEIKKSVDGSYQIYVMAERSGRNSGRVYSIAITSEDAAGNLSEEVVEVSVGHDRGSR